MGCGASSSKEEGRKRKKKKEKKEKKVKKEYKAVEDEAVWVDQVKEDNADTVVQGFEEEYPQIETEVLGESTKLKVAEAKEKLNALVGYINEQPLLHTDKELARHFHSKLEELPHLYQRVGTTGEERGDSMNSLQFLCDDVAQKTSPVHVMAQPQSPKASAKVGSRTSPTSKRNLGVRCISKKFTLSKSKSTNVNVDNTSDVAWDGESDGSSSQRSMVSHVLHHIAGGSAADLAHGDSMGAFVVGELEQLLISASEIVKHSSDTQSVISTVVSREVKKLLIAESATLWWVDGQDLRAYVDPVDNCGSSVDPGGEAKTVTISISSLGRNSPEADVMSSRGSFHFRAECGNRQATHIEKHEIREVLYHPVKHKGEVLAICKCCNKRQKSDIDFSDDEVNMLSSLLVFTGVCLHNFVLYANLKKSVENTQRMLDLTSQVSASGLNITKMCDCIMQTAQSLLNSEACRLFLVDKYREELVLMETYHTKITHRSPVSIGIEGWVYREQRVVNLLDAREHQFFCEDLDVKMVFSTRSILCVPVLCNGEVVAVAQLLNKQSEVGFSMDDQSCLTSFCEYCGSSIGNVLVHEAMMREKQATDSLFATVQDLEEVDLADATAISQKIQKNLKTLITCQDAGLWVVNKEHGQLQPPGPDQTITASIESSVAGRCVKTGQPVNAAGTDLNDATKRSDPFLKEFVVENTLCIPIKNLENDVIAVCQLINKAEGPFTPDDLRIMGLFSRFAGMCLRTAGLIEFMKKSSLAHSKLVKLMSSAIMPKNANGHRNHLVKAKQHAFITVDLTLEETTLILQPSFPIHNYQINLPSHKRLVTLCGELFSSFGIPKEFKVQMGTLHRFAAAIQQKYRQIPYHNFTHAFDVAQTVCSYLNVLPSGKYMTSLDRFALILTALCHDIDHMGLNNSFQLKAETPLGVLSSQSGSKSVLEVHHCNLTIEILSDPDTNILSGLTQQEAKDAWRSVIDCILGTDMARHQELSSSFEELMENYDSSESSNRRLLMTMLLKAADISNVTKPFQISKLWAHRITDEFNWQGDTEKAAGLDVTMNHGYENIQSVQLGFIHSVALPMYTLLAKGIPELSYLIDELNTNITLWGQGAHEEKFHETDFGQSVCE